MIKLAVHLCKDSKTIVFEIWFNGSKLNELSVKNAYICIILMVNDAFLTFNNF